MSAVSTPTSITRRRAGAASVVLVLALVLGLSACNQDNTPSSYNTLTEQNFLELCTNSYWSLDGDITANDTATTLDPVLSQTSSTIKADVTTPTSSQCVCQYNVFVNQVSYNKTNVVNGYSGPYFVDLNVNLKTDPEKAWATVPEGVRNALQGCMGGASTPTSSTTSTSAAPTTVAN